MEPYYDRNGTTLYNGDCLEVMRAMPEASVTAIVTDPPYGLEFMGKGWDKAAPAREVWAECLRVAKPGAMLLAFGGTRTFHRLTCAIEDAGWEVRDCLAWLYGSGFPKSLDVSKAIDKAAGAEREVVGQKWADRYPNGPGGNSFSVGADPDGKRTASNTLDTAPATTLARTWSGYGTALKPAWEPIVLAMKPLDGTFAANAEKHGIAGLNVEGCRIGTETLPEHRAGQSRVGTFERTDMVTPERSGRWPANVALDEEAARLLDEMSGEAGGGFGTRGALNGGATKWGFDGHGQTVGFGDSGGASRFFYTAKASRSERGSSNDHPTVKPLDLMRWLVRLVSMPEGTVILDPFAGSGTTLVAAREEHVRAIGIEREARYCEHAMKRLAQEVLPYA